MALDAITVRAIVDELNMTIINCRIDKIYQSENNQLLLHIRGKERNNMLLISANANSARINLVQRSLNNPIEPPTFCMVLRKHLIGGRIVAVEQPDWERIVEIKVETYDELGDKTQKKLITEIMGRHSNIILINAENMIIDSIKHINRELSRVRQVLPGLPYVRPPKQDKLDPFSCTSDELFSRLSTQPSSAKIIQALPNIINGISRSTAYELISIAGLKQDETIEDINEEKNHALYVSIQQLLAKISQKLWHPCIIYNAENQAVDFSALPVHWTIEGGRIEYFESISLLLDHYYREKDILDHIKQKTSELRKLLDVHLERLKRKLEVQQQELEQNRDIDRYMLYGQLLTANLYRIKEGSEGISLPNFYSENMDDIYIPLNPQLTPSENAQQYFKRYNKAKNAIAALMQQIEQTQYEIEYLESQLDNLERCTDEADIDDIRQELIEQGYIKHKSKAIGKAQGSRSLPHHYISSTGMDIYVGKNNAQNDMLTLKWASKNDWWLHVKDLPGSHVIIRLQGKQVDQQTLLEAAMLAAHYSKGRNSSNIPVDYTQCKYINKPAGAKPGKVIYHNYKTIFVTPNNEIIQKLRKA